MVWKSSEKENIRPPWDRGKTFLIAEAGVNHNGDIAMALEMIELAASAGADAVKFQTFTPELLASPLTPLADYQRKVPGYSNQLDMLRTLVMSFEDHYKLKSRAQELGILFFSTAFDEDSVKFLMSIGQKIWKIPSGELTNYPYLIKIAALNRPTILSTGMATLSEISATVQLLEDNGLELRHLCILQCNSAYPTPMNDVNLRAMSTLGAAFGCSYGFSDHTSGIVASVVAASLGAATIEKHFTLDKNLPGPDHASSLSPEELRQWVSSIRSVEDALGNSVKKPTNSELKNIDVVRKTIVASRAIASGELFSQDNLAVKRAKGGLSPMLWPQLMGRPASRYFANDETIEI